MGEAEIEALLLAMPEAERSSHLGTADYRVRNKIYASHPEPGLFVLKLTPEQQEVLVGAAAEAFAPVPHRWGKKGWTNVRIGALDEITARSAIRMAWQNVAPRTLQKSLDGAE